MKRVLQSILLLICVCLVFSACGTKTEITTSEVFFEDSESESNLSGNSSTNASKNNTSSTQSTKGGKNNSSSKKQNSSSKKSNVTDNSTSSKKTNVENLPESGNPNNTSNPSAKNYIEQSSGSNSLRVYEAPSGFETCENFSVFVRLSSKENWVEVPVFFAEVARSGQGVHRTYFSSVTLKGEMEAKIVPSSDFSSYEVLPKSDASSIERGSKSVSFKVKKACQLVVKFDDDVFDCLQLFVDPYETNVPSSRNSNVIYFGAGVHTISNNPKIVGSGSKKFPTITLKSNQTLYLAPGAVVKARVVVESKATNVKICGRGIIDLLDFNSPTGNPEEVKKNTGGIYPAGIHMSKSRNVTIDGVIIRDSISYGVTGNGVKDVSINNIKIFSRGTWSDGIDCVASNNIKIKNCYIRTNDDGIAIYATRWEYKGSAENWEIDNIVFNIDCAHAVNIGTHGSQDAKNRDKIQNITFKNLDIIDVFEKSKTYYGAIGFMVGDENIVRNISFENIRMYGLTKSRPFTIKVVKNKSFNPVPGYLIEDITFKNVTLFGDDYLTDYNSRSQISGYSADRVVSGVTFENLVICGKKVTGDNMGTYFKISDHVNNVSFK